MQLDLVFELARLQDRPADADGLMRHQLEYLASAACDRSGSERAPKVASYKKPITATLGCKRYNRSSTKPYKIKGQACRLINISQHHHTCVQMCIIGFTTHVGPERSETKDIACGQNTEVLVDPDC